MPPQDVLALCVAAGFVFIYGRIWFRRHREAPLRREIRTRDVTFRTVLDRVKVSDSSGWPKWAEVSAPMGLFVRGDAIEVSSTAAPLRAVMGLEYYFPAAETSIELSRSPSRIYRKDWIVLAGRQAGKDIQVAITTTNDCTLLEAWKALVTAGAIPAGLPSPGTRIRQTLPGATSAPMSGRRDHGPPSSPASALPALSVRADARGTPEHASSLHPVSAPSGPRGRQMAVRIGPERRGWIGPRCQTIPLLTWWVPADDRRQPCAR